MSRRTQHGTVQSGSSTINQKAALASAYQELGKELSSAKLKAVGNYTLQRVIGEGTYGKVRLGLHRLTNTRVAIKQVPKAHSASLTREIHHHRRLHHPNVIKLYEVIATEQNIWMVSELCAGGELYDYLVERQTLPEPEARRIFGQLCLALAYIHAKGIVHRDLKLENVLLDERCNVKLGDFGFTREYEANKLMDTFCGTTGYAAPEMLAAKRYTGEQVDIWSLGIILYALLCGALPFDDDDETIMKSKILKGEFEIPDVLSPEAQDLIQLILQRDPAKRPSIKAILAHPWFSKVLATTSMSTLEESSPLPEDYLEPRPVSVSSQEPKQSDDALVTHKQSVSALSESSFFSALSADDSESSGRRSSTTDITDPSTSESASKRGSQEDQSAGSGPSESSSSAPLAEFPSSAVAKDTERIGLHRNESQTTIKRASSNGSSDASWATAGAANRAASLSASTSLPTHHEMTSGGESEELIFTASASASALPPSPSTRSSSLVKTASQSSSRGGHHRTPSRTKRRSLSSGGLSDHHPPHLGIRPIDYVAQLTHPQPAMFSTGVEQNLLHQLSSLGIDVGQMVHSIMTDACDASGAMWWMLIKKAQEREAYDVHTPGSAASSTHGHGHGHPPPPVPKKDPARPSRPPAASRHSADPVVSRLHTVVSQDELDASSASASASASTSLSSIATPDSQAPPSAQRTPTAKDASPLTKSSAGRARSNSLSMKQFASSVLGTRDRDRASPAAICIAGETLPLERAKSPSIFSKRSAGGTGDSAPSTPRKAEATSPVTGAGGVPGSVSVDSFSTPQKQRTGSSFMATVRTWLGDRPRKAKNTPPVSPSPDSPRPTPVRRHYQQSSVRRTSHPHSPQVGGSISRRSSTASAKHFDSHSRPGTLRRPSAGSITPTATLYGDEHRPSSSHSHSRSASAGRRTTVQREDPGVFVAHKNRGAVSWRFSWGRPPPSWAGPVDPAPAPGPSSTAERGGKTDVRDVFADDADQEWTDEDDDPVGYAGGLGQVNANANPAWAAPGVGMATGSPFASRYASARSIFQPPSLGNEFAPKLTLIDEPKPKPKTETDTIRTRAQQPAFKSQVIEEEEEDE